MASTSGRLDTRRLVSLARPELPRLVVATIALLISSSMVLAYPQVIRYMVDAVVEGESLEAVDLATLVLLGAFVVQSVFSMLRAWLFTVAGERIVADLRKNLFRAIISQDIAFFDERRTGELTNRLASDTTVLQNAVTVNVSMVLRHTMSTLGGVVLLVWMSPVLAGVSMAVVPVVAVGAALYGRLIRRLSVKVQDALAASTEVAEETIAGVRTVRSFAREASEVDRYGQRVEDSFALAAKRALAIGGFSGIAGFLGYGALALVVWYGGRMVLDGRLTIGDLTAFIVYTMIVAVSLGSLAGLYGDFMRAVGASQRVFELMDLTAAIEMADGNTPPERIEGRVRFDHVRFAYPSRPDVTVLDDFDLAIEPGELVALVGPSGAGKSTVASLLLRLYDPQSGALAVDGHDIRSFDPRQWRERVGSVSQEPILFATTISDNIRYGRADATDEQVRAAARAANAEVFVDAFPEGFDTLVGERGVRLSGGQKQRIAIARAVLRDPRVLILDEATSALDAESEHLVKEALDRLMEGRTTIVIAHRLSTVIDADRVVVLDGGRVVQSGPHDGLMNEDGLYRRLVERQFSK
ncbi:MAG: ABC transporter transmembrane domain-containing protein [Deltaproteobacteria bacterium]